MQHDTTSTEPIPLRTAEAAANPRVVYFITSHANPEQVARLARTCRTGSPNSRVLVHHDYAGSDLSPSLIEPVGNVDVLRAEGPVGWGKFRICSAVIRSMRWLLANRDFDWAVYLSGQCYPLRPMAQIERFLAESPVDGYMSTFPLADLPWEVGRMRYLYRYYELPKFRGWSRLRSLIDAHADRRLRAGKLPRMWVSREEAFRVGLRPPFGPFNESFQCYKGSPWWMLRRHVIQYMIDYVDRHPSLVRHYQRSQFAPDESMYHTILRNAPGLNLDLTQNKRFIRWSRAEHGHPDLLGVEHFDQMVRSGAFFARKFDVRHDARVLDMLDDHIGITPPRAAAV